MNPKPSLRIIFAGTPDFAASHLEALLENGEHEVIAVYSQPDRPAGRGKKLKPSPVKKVALDHNIPVFQPLSLKNEEAQSLLASHNADLLVVVAYGLILPREVLDTPRLGCINVHASILPRWRGAAPIQRAIEAGDTSTGVTIMQMDIGLDTGDMLLKASCDIEEHDTGGSLHDKLVELGRPNLITAINQLASNQACPEKQDDAQSNYASKISKSDPIIDWQQPARAIQRKIRAFNPFPICYTILNGDRVKIWQASLGPKLNQDAQKQAAGSILHADKKGITVRCGDGSLTLQSIQLPGGKALDIAAVMNSKATQFSPGTLFSSPMAQEQ